MTTTLPATPTVGRKTVVGLACSLLGFVTFGLGGVVGITLCRWARREGRGGWPAGVGVALGSLSLVFGPVLGLLPGVQNARYAAQRSQSRCHVFCVAFTSFDFCGVEGHFPAPTAPEATHLPLERRLSLHAALLPYMGERQLHDRLTFDMPWDAPENATATSATVRSFLEPRFGVARSNVTHYVGVAGGPAGDGMFAVGERPVTLADVTDGTVNTLLAVSTSPDDCGPWAQGGHSTVRRFTARPCIDGPDGVGDPRGMMASMVSGGSRFFDPDTDPAIIEALATRAAGD